MEQKREHRRDPLKYNHLIFDKGAKAIEWSQDILLDK